MSTRGALIWASFVSFSSAVLVGGILGDVMGAIAGLFIWGALISWCAVETIR